MLREVPAADPKDYSLIMGRLARQVREAVRASTDAENYVCDSSGIAELRAAWFLLAAPGVLPATPLQVGTPVQLLFGDANIREVHIDTPARVAKSR